jgi:hypothetical protein
VSKKLPKLEAKERMFVSIESARESSKVVGLKIFWRPDSRVDPDGAGGRDLAELLD